MARKTIRIPGVACERLKTLKKDKKTSCSEAINRLDPAKRKLADALGEIGNCTDLTDSVGKSSRAMRKSRLRPVKF